jgi:hypothetical protein
MRGILSDDLIRMPSIYLPMLHCEFGLHFASDLPGRRLPRSSPASCQQFCFGALRISPVFASFLRFRVKGATLRGRTDVIGTSMPPRLRTSRVLFVTKWTRPTAQMAAGGLSSPATTVTAADLFHRWIRIRAGLVDERLCPWVSFPRTIDVDSQLSIIGQTSSDADLHDAAAKADCRLLFTRNPP